jgi:hypothetical protein
MIYYKWNNPEGEDALKIYEARWWKREVKGFP